MADPTMPPSHYHEFDHVNHYWDKQKQKHIAKILPGEFYLSRSDILIATTLGSCVSACIWDEQMKIGGMNHFMLPNTDKEADNVLWGSQHKISTATRYGNFAMEHLINGLLKYGANKTNLKVKVFGGAKVVGYMTDVGERNINFVQHYLKTEKLVVVSEDLGDFYPRKLLFDPLSGKVLMKKLRNLHNNTIVAREQSYQSAIASSKIDGDVELF
ncbi:chemoreceptor glutamine deamidase CheD [Thalassotalea sp. LPB0316]|uniref:chemoreceptor glutamine deamidase CheD n=1 Tax=Thalassotalea sp. LPB0316 TaxID=2769490 RepID=UPI0018677A6A|nr:chemoreceptor glutamine deamidase CheD [Thalassotalea sp. LPB0316]QOL24775.1 chemoreceptor glutamine deamidase CheD [Thalassotalea sp. LPB0316]